MATILLTNSYSRALQEVIRAELPEGFGIIALEAATKAEVIKHAPEADYLLVGGRLAIDADVLAAAPKLRMVQRTGVGLDAMDLTAMQARGIPVYVNPGVNARSVAEHTILLMLATLRRLPAVDAAMRQGLWVKHESGIRNRDLGGRRVGLLGLGHIGKHVAAMLRPFGATVVYHKPNRLSEEEERALGIAHVPLDELLRRSEVLSLHCPLTPDTRGIISRERMSTMPKGAILINTARGPLVDHAALVDALRSGQLAGAGLDVFDPEPLPANDALRAMPDAVMTPHISGITLDSFRTMMRRGFSNIERFQAGDLDAIAPMRLI